MVTLDKGIRGSKGILNKLLGGFKKYPLLSTLIVISTAIGVILAYTTKYNHDFNSFDYIVLRLFMASHLILPAILAVSLSRGWLDNKKWLYTATSVGVIIMLLGYTFIIYPWSYGVYKTYESPGLLAYQYILMLVFSLSSVFVLPYFLKGQKEDFLNKSLWAHILQVSNGVIVAAVYAAVTFVGLSLALVAMDNLWGINVEEWAYLAIFIVAANLVGYLRLTNSVDDVVSIVESAKLNKVTEIFAKFILVPLISIYTIILYPYIIKVIVTGKWPENLITPLALVFVGLAYSIVTILFFNKKIKVLKILPAISLPIIMMQLYGLWVRIDAYGFTVNRVELSLAAVIIFCLSVYFIVSKKPKLIMLPVSIMILILLTPISFIVSKRDQLNKHTEIMDQYKAVNIDGQIDSLDTSITISYNEHEELLSTFNYLVTYHKLSSLKSILADDIYTNLESVNKEMSLYKLQEEYLKSLNIGYDTYYSLDYYNYQLDKGEANFVDFDIDVNLKDIKPIYRNRYSREYADFEDGLPIALVDDNWHIELEDKTFVVTPDQQEIILANQNDRDDAHILIFDSIDGQYKLLIFEIGLEDQHNNNTYLLSNINAWLIKL